MNGSFTDAKALIEDIMSGLEQNPQLKDQCDFLVCPPFLHMGAIRDVVKNDIHFGGQDCVAHDNGAYTGDISAVMLKDMDCDHVILGHSERRQYHKESDEAVCEKAAKAHEAGLVAIICVGETDEERTAGRQEDVIGKQLENSIPASATAQNTVIAYEPVWAIGTGNSATADDVETMHSFIRKKVEEKLADSDKVRILYGGSVKPENAGTLLNIENVNGALIGGASLKADQFLGIAKAI